MLEIDMNKLMTFIISLFGLLPQNEKLSVEVVQPLAQSYISLNNNFSVGQIYVPTHSNIPKISVYMKGPERALPGAKVSLELKTEWSSEPLFSSTVTAEKIPLNGAWVEFSFDNTVKLEQGKAYILRISTNMPQEAGCKIASATDYFYDLYPEGTALCSWKDNAPQMLPYSDLAFKVYTTEKIEKIEKDPSPKLFFMNVDYSDNFVPDWAGQKCFGNIEGVSPKKEIFESLKQLKESGFDGVFWRVSVLGRVMYHSKMRDIYSLTDADNNSYKKLAAAIEQCDPLREAVAVCRQLNLKIYAWVLLNDEGRTQETAASFFVKNPNLQWVSRKSGKYLSGVPCYAFPEVREHFLLQMKELMGYGVDGVFMSTRSHSTSFKKDTLMEFGFNKPVLDAFKDKYGKDISKSFDPDSDGDCFIRVQGDSMNDFYREVKVLRDKYFPNVRLAADLSFLPQNWPLWVKEKLVDYLIVDAASGSYGILPSGSDYKDIPDFYVDAVKKMHGTTGILMWTQIVNYKEQTYHSKEEFCTDISELMQSGSSGAVIHEHANFMKYPDEFYPYLKKARNAK